MHSLLEDGDGVSIDHKFPILSLNSAMETAMSGIIFEHVDLKMREVPIVVLLVLRFSFNPLSLYSFSTLPKPFLHPIYTHAPDAYD